MSRVNSGKKASQRKKDAKHAPLSIQIDPSIGLEYVKGKTTRDTFKDDDIDENSALVSGRMSKKIMQAIKQQRQDIEADDDAMNTEEAAEQGRKKLESIKASDLLQRDTADSDDEIGDVPDDAEFELDDGDDHADYDDGEEELELNPDDRAALDMFFPTSLARRDEVSTAITSELRQREQAIELGIAQTKEGTQQLESTVSRNVIIAYQKTGQFLQRYRNGKLPKPFKIIPTLRNWEEILYYTQPSKWSPQATNASVRLFVTVLPPRSAQRFFSLILAPKVHEEIESTGKLGYHLYESLRRAIYKPTAFFKGLILPLASNGCTTREAIVYASVLNRIKIPPMHASVNLLQLCRMKCTPITTLFMRVLINKKFSLPTPVIHALAEYFYRIALDKDTELTVLWHRTFLSFVQRYKFSLSPDQIAMLRVATKKRHHKGISHEIITELQNAINGTQLSGPDVSIPSMLNMNDTHM